MNIQTTDRRTPAYVNRGVLLSALCISTLLLASCGGGSGTESAITVEGRAQALAVPPGWTGRPPKYEVINGITVPPEPAPTLNNATLTGVDINNNGVRDDVERKVAVAFGTNAVQHTAALSRMKAYQKWLQSPLPSTRQQALAMFSEVECNGDTVPPSRINYISEVFNIESRKQVYIRVSELVGAFLGSELTCSQ